MESYTFNQLPQKIVVRGKFDDSCEINISQQTLNSIENGKLKLSLNNHGGSPFLSGFNARIESISGNINIYVGHNDSSVTFGEGSLGLYDLRLWRKSNVSIGKKTTSNGVRIVCNNSGFICGEDCMFSDSILIQTADQHGIVDISSGLIINDTFKTVVLGNHVWLGRQCILTSNARVGDGSIIGTGAIVSGNIPDKVIAVGTPARVVKDNHTWCRNPVSLDVFSQSYIQENT